MRSQDEILARAREKRQEFLNFEGEVLIPYLDFDHAREFLKDEATEQDWKPYGEEQIMIDMPDYMEFAWGKAEGHRGISANRSVNKMCAWLFLLGDDELLAFAEDDANFPYYGAPVLKAICDKYEFLIPDSEAIRNMAQGYPCMPNCEEGC